MGEMARRIRLDALEMVYRAQSGHLGGSFSEAEILEALYGRVLRYRPDQPDWPDRDRFILSKGHASPGYYAVLAYSGFFDREELWGFRRFGSLLPGHPSMHTTPGVDFSSGSLGLGLGVGCGMAEGLTRRQSPARIYVLMGDGELNEGQVWESLLFAAKRKYANLTAIVDANGVQLDGRTEDIMPTEPLSDKFRAFGWRVRECDGHDVSAIEQALLSFKDSNIGPCALIARTVKGKGVSFMEGDCAWHGKAPNQAQYEMAKRELEGGERA